MHSNRWEQPCNAVPVTLMRRCILQDVVWEKLDAIDGNTVYVGSQIRPPGDSLCCNVRHGVVCPA